MSRDDNAHRRAASAPPVNHPTADALLGYAEEELVPEIADRVRRHLESCAECQELVQDFAAYPRLEPPGDAYRIAKEEMRATLGELRVRSLISREPTRRQEPGERGRLVSDAQAQEEELSKPMRRQASVPSSRRWSWAAAALIILSSGWGLHRQLAVGRLEGRIETLESRLMEAVAALQGPRANAQVVTLLATDDPLRSPQAWAISPGAAGITAVIQPDKPFPPIGFAGEIRDRDSKTVLRIEGLEPRPAGILFYLPPGSLAPGDYQVWLIRDDGEVWPTTYELPISE